MAAPNAHAVSASCQKALDDAEIAQRNFDTISKDPTTSEEDKKNAEDEANMTASTAQRFCDSTDSAVTGSVKAGLGGTQGGTGPGELAGGAALLAAGAAGGVMIIRRRAAGER